MNQESFFLANQVNGELSDAQTMQMLDLPEGDSAQAQSSVPDAATTPEPEAQVEDKTVESKQVIVAKDGVHTIPYEKLTEAREAEQHWKRVAQEASQLLEAHKATPAAPPQVPETAATSEPDTDIFGDYSEEALAKGVEKLVASRTAAIEAKFEARFAAVLEPIQKQRADSATDQHFSAINAKHPDVESVVQSAEFATWVDAQPSFVRDGVKAVIEAGTADQVIEALDAYKTATGRLAAATGKPSAVAAAQAAIAKAQAAVPMSLSEIPAGSSAHTDEHAAMLEMSSTGLMDRFDGKTPEQIMALMNRVL